jgi:hypothetical protein
MTKFTCLTLFAAILVFTLHINPAQAQRVFVAATGTDGNPCTFASPCRSFQHAHDTTGAGGEIDVLDPAGYGAVTITKAISIQGHGFSGITVASGANGITINAGASDKISLRGLLLDGVGTGSIGIFFTGGSSLEIQESVIRNFSQVGIFFEPNASSNLSLSDTLISDNKEEGILIRPLGSGAVNGILDRVQVINNGAGISAENFSTGSLNVTISDSAVVESAIGLGIACDAFSGGGPSACVVRNSTSAYNLYGLTTNNATLWVTRSTITGNSLGFGPNFNGGSTISFGDNSVVGNGTDGAPTSTILPK